MLRAGFSPAVSFQAVQVGSPGLYLVPTLAWTSLAHSPRALPRSRCCPLGVPQALGEWPERVPVHEKASGSARRQVYVPERLKCRR